MSICNGNKSGKKDNRQKILDAALHLFTTRGFHATPTSAVCREAGVSSGTLFYYFPDKESLISGLYLSLKREMSDVFTGADNPYRGVRERIESIMRAYIEWCLENPGKEQFMTQFCNSPNIAEDVREEARSRFEWTGDLIREGISSGVLVDIPVGILQLYLFRSAADFLRLIRDKDPVISVDDFFGYYTRVLWHGVLKENTGMDG